MITLFIIIWCLCKAAAIADDEMGIEDAPYTYVETDRPIQ